MTESPADAGIPGAAALTVADLFRDRASRHRDRVALEQDGRRWTYGALEERVNRLARALAARGVGRGERIAVLSENRHEFVEAELAAASLGTIVACQNWRQSREELAYCLALAEPCLCLVSERFEARLAEVGGGALPGLVFGPRYEAALAAESAAPPPDRAEPEDGLVILYTSGTTGMPKGALISQRAMVARAIIARADQSAFPEETFVAWSPMFHMGATDSALATLMHGGKVIIQDGFDPAALVAVLAHEALGWLSVMPGTAEPLLEELRRTGARPRGVRLVGAMADLIAPAAIAELTERLQAPFRNTFGSTETGPGPASRGRIRVGATPARLSKVQSSYCRIRLVDPEDREVPDGEPGEVAFRGPSLFSGYWRAPDTNARDFRGGWFHMGDVMRRNPDGTLDFVDRVKYLIKSGGENIYPAEIERVLLASPRVSEAVVVRRPDARWGEVPVAFVARRDEALTEAELIAACRAAIAGYKVPKEIRFIEEAALPRSTTGKIRRHELEALLRPPPA